MLMVDRPRGGRDVTHTTLSVLLLAVLVVSTFWVLSPFLTSILWATVVSVATWPLLLRLEAILGGRRRIAVAIMTVLILLVVFVPVTLALITIIRNTQGIASDLRSFEAIAIPPAPPWLERIPFQGERMAAEWTRFRALDPAQRAAALAPYAHAALQWFVAKAGSVGTMLLQFLLTAIISAVVLANGERVRDGLLRFAMRMAGRQGYETALLAARTIRGVVLGIAGTALVQAAIAGTGLFLAGVPAAALLTAVTLFFCLAQLGPVPVVLPAVVWLFWSGRTASGTILLVIAIVAMTLDNVVRPLLIKRGVNLPLILIFAGVLGGLIAFGIIGLFIGPVVLTVAYTMLTTWTSRESDVPDAVADDTPVQIR